MSATDTPPHYFAGRRQALLVGADRVELRATGWARWLPCVPHRIVLRREEIVGVALADYGRALHLFTHDRRTLVAALDEASVAARDLFVSAFSAAA